MNREQAKALLPIIAAFAEGKEIEYRSAHHGPANNGWTQAKWLPDLEGGMQFRIKPEPTWRPWTEKEVPRVIVTIPKGLKEHTAIVPDVQWGWCLRGPVLLKMLDECLWLHEDGTTTPCGVLVQP